MSPPTWQQMPRSTGTWMIFCSVPRSIVDARPLEARELDVALERREVRGRAEERRVALVDRGRRRVVDRGVQRRRVVQVDPAVGGEVRVQRDALEPFLVVLVDVELCGERLQARAGIVQPDLARALGVQDAGVRQDREVHRLARGGVDDDLLELGRRRRLGGRERGRMRSSASAPAMLASARIRTSRNPGSRSPSRRPRTGRRSGRRSAGRARRRSTSCCRRQRRRSSGSR